MKCRMILPVGLLACLVCFGGARASAFELFRMLGEEAAVAEPPAVADPAPLENGKFEAEQKGFNAPCQTGCEPVARPCRPRLWGWGRTCCEPACGVESTVQKGCCSGVEQKEFDMSKDSEVQKEARK